MGVPVFDGVAFTSLWIGRGNFFTPWGYALHHGGTPYTMRVPTTTWNVFPYLTRGSKYPIGEKGTFTKLEKNVVPHTPWGWVHFTLRWGYPTT